MGLEQGLGTLFWVVVIAAVAPIITEFLPGPRIPQVVWLIIGGVVVGPDFLDWTDPGSIELLTNVGLGFLFLLAGYELDLALFKDRPGRLAVKGWVVSAILAVSIVGVLAWTGFVDAFIPVAIGLTTTALGTLLPALREHGLIHSRFGRYVFAAGAVGEVFPIIAIALFLSTRREYVAILSLLIVGVLALGLATVPRFMHGTRIQRLVEEGELTTSQTTVRATVLLLTLFLVVAEEFGLDVVLGALLAGMVLRHFAPSNSATFEHKMDAVAHGFFIPVFFVTSGMALEARSIAEAPGRLVVFFVLLLVVRGLPSLLIYRSLVMRERVQLTFITATALPLLVALTHIGLENGTMLPENAAALVGAGVLSLVVFPAAAIAVAGDRQDE